MDDLMGFMLVKGTRNKKASTVVISLMCGT
jgi:hypothetical protein